MKKFKLVNIAVVAVMLFVLVTAVALAGSVYGRATKALGVATGSGVWTNSSKYAAVKLERIWVESSLNATNVITVTRITSDGVYTQAVGSVTCAAGSGSTASFTAAYLQDGDMLSFSSLIATGSTAIIEYEFQKQ